MNNLKRTDQHVENNSEIKQSVSRNFPSETKFLGNSRDMATSISHKQSVSGLQKPSSSLPKHHISDMYTTKNPHTKQHTVRELSGYDRLKLAILVHCWNTWKTSREVAEEIHHPVRATQKRCSSLRNDYPKKYLNLKKGKKGKGSPNKYRASAYGKRICQRLLARLKEGKDLHLRNEKPFVYKSILDQIKERSENFDPKNKKPDWVIR
ncbi:MAG: hypothetical protein FIB07_17015 [Candidatus Methanoperedens sp.]|nr:hypothetical protein [Candidatus Methanoperedens sp.]